MDLTVSDLERSVAFYDRVLGRLGFRRLDEFGAGAPCWGITDAQAGYFSMALQSATVGDARANRTRCGVHHLAFHADDRDDVDDVFEFLVRLGTVVLDPPAEYDYTPGYYAVFFEDPDGLKLEVVHEPALRGNVSRTHDVESAPQPSFRGSGIGIEDPRVDESGRSMTIRAIKPFVPSGADFQLALAFFRDLGFIVAWESEELAELSMNGVAFLLQNYQNDELQRNLMMMVLVDDLDTWWARIVESGVLDRYAGARAKPPTDYPWGQREIHLIDPAGVCWHFC